MRHRWALTVMALCLSSGLAYAQANSATSLANGQTALRVCQDPNNMPFSNTNGEGIENHIAKLMAQALGVPVTYYSFPQRMGFIRNTLRYKLPTQDYPCDIVMGVPLGFDQVATTHAYYRSSYALVFPTGAGLDGVQSVEDFLKLDAGFLRQLRIGVYDRSPASAWLSQHGLLDSGVPYKMLSADPDQYPGSIIEHDLVQRQIDVALVWGPMAAYFAKRTKAHALRVVPVRSEPGLTMEFDMAMGIRHGEPLWKAQIETVIQSQQAQILAILKSFDVSVLEAPHAATKQP